MENIIEVKNLSKAYEVKAQDVLVLKNINLTIKKGDFFLIYGPSGCGKSTLLNSILGLETPTSGSVSILGHDIFSLDEDSRTELRKQTIGTIYQQSTWIRSLTVLENVSFPLIMSGIEKKTAEIQALEKLKLVGMERWRDYLTSELSAGQKQKAALARALVTSPQIIIADEPTGNMDFNSGENLMKNLAELNGLGITIIAVTHDLNYTKYASTIAQVFDGEIIKIHNLNENNVDQVREELRAIPKVLNSSKANPPRIEKSEQSSKQGLLSGLKSFLSNMLIVFPTILFLFFYTFCNVITGITKILDWISRREISNKISYQFYKLFRSFEGQKKGIRKIDIIQLAYKNMKFKQLRSRITIIGISIGISMIVLLLSVGYGLEDAVISKVASMKARNQIDISPALNTNITLSDDIITEFKGINSVQKIYPVINAAGKVKYDESVIDVVVFGVQHDYLQNSDIEIKKGELYDSNQSGLTNIESGESITNSDSNTTSDTSATAITSVADSTTDSSGIETASETDQKMKNITDFGGREALVNETFLRGLNLTTSNAIGKEFKVNLIIGNELTGKNKIQSFELTYKIVAVTTEETTPVIYIPMDDLINLGAVCYSEARIVFENEEAIENNKAKFEAGGFTVYSVKDTIKSIESIFNVFRMVLSGVGMGALIIASLGVFNTLTVSLLERTREIGLMKVIGMKSKEIFDLFLTEAISIGVGGGVLGIGLGWLLGKIASLTLSLISITKGGSTINITILPWFVVLFVVILSTVIGILTGIYPARRAAKITALDALRYE